LAPAALLHWHSEISFATCGHSTKPTHVETRSNLMETLMVLPRMIKESMEVVGSDGAHVGIVDCIDGINEIKLTKNDPDACGGDHYIPLTWVVHAEIKVHLAQPGEEAKARWSTH